MIFRKLACAAMGVLILCPISLAFSDLTEKDWVYKQVMFMQEEGIINGFGDDTFKPQEEVTREQFSVILTKALNLKEDAEAKSFEDVSLDRWSKRYIDSVSKYLKEYSYEDKFYFKPTESACREDVIVAIVKAIDLQDDEPDYSLLKNFSDEKDISSDARGYIALAIEKGIISGNVDGTLNPLGSLTRAEISSIVYNVLIKKDVYKDEEKDVEEIEENIDITCSIDTPCYGGQTTTFKVEFDKIPDEAYFHFNNSQNPDEWLNESYNRNEIPIERISKIGNKYVYEAEIYAPWKSGERKVRIVASYNGKNSCSNPFEFVIKEIPGAIEDKSKIGFEYEQLTSQREDIEEPIIGSVTKEASSEGCYILTVEDYSCDKEGFPFFFWKTDNGEFEGATADFKSVIYLPYGHSTVTVYMGDALGKVTSYEIVIEP